MKNVKTVGCRMCKYSLYHIITYMSDLRGRTVIADPGVGGGGGGGVIGGTPKLYEERNNAACVHTNTQIQATSKVATIDSMEGLNYKSHFG